MRKTLTETQKGILPSISDMLPKLSPTNEAIARGFLYGLASVSDGSNKTDGADTEEGERRDLNGNI